MRIAIGNHVWTAGGRDAGTIAKLVLDSNTHGAKSAVIHKGAIFPHDVEVPIDRLATKGDGDVIVDRTAAELTTPPAFNEAEYRLWPATSAGPWGYLSAALLWPAVYSYRAVPYEAPDRYTSVVGREIEDAHLREDFENAIVDAGSDVVSSDGKKVGAIDPVDRRHEDRSADRRCRAPGAHPHARCHATGRDHCRGRRWQARSSDRL